MLTAQQAEELILNLVHPFSDRDREIVSVLDAADRILAELVTSSFDFPHWDNSAMDGYAVRYEDVQTATATTPIELAIIEEISAGMEPQQVVQSGQAARIFTGAVMPDGADTIVMQENTQRESDRVTILTAPKPAAFIRKRGSYHQAGEPLLAVGCRLGAAEIAILAAAQCPQVKVFRRPRVAILSTGNELVSLDRPLQPGQIVDSNQYALTVLVRQAGCEPVPLGIVPDDPDRLRTTIEQAIATADVVLSSGGVSVGDYDYVDRILGDLGATIHIRAVAVKPGKPLTVATFTSPPSSASPSPSSPLFYFGLPGNPVSALVTFWRFVQPALRKLSGIVPPWHPVYVNAITHQELRSHGKHETYIWGTLQQVNGRYEFEVAGGNQVSGNLINLAGTNGLAIVPLGDTTIAPGASVQVLQMS